MTTVAAPAADGCDPRVVEVLPPDVTTMDLSEAHRIVGGGAGLDGPERFEQLAAVAASLVSSKWRPRAVTASVPSAVTVLSGTSGSVAPLAACVASLVVAIATASPSAPAVALAMVFAWCVVV